MQRCNPAAARKPAAAEGRQHHAREAAYPRCIGACNPSSRIGRAGGVDAYTPTTLHHCQPPREKLALSLQWWCCSSVSCCCAGSSSVRFSSNYACLLPPFAYLCIRPPPRSVSAVRAALPGLLLVNVLTYPILKFACNNTMVDALRRYTASSATGSSSSRSSPCDFHRQPGGQQQY